MSKKIIFLGIIAITSVVAFIYYKNYTRPRVQSACTQEAKMCPDGSFVSRGGIQCEFAPCSNEVVTSKKIQSKGYLVGQVTISPTCPVERIPPDSQCAPKPYSTLIDITGVHNFYIQIHTDVAGGFYATLPVGNYKIFTHSNSGQLYPACESQNVLVQDNATTTVHILCDTGIR